MRKIILLTFCLVLSGCRTSPDGRVNVKNNSDFKIKSLDIEICKQKFVAENMMPDSSVSFKYFPKSDSHYDLKVEYEDGRIIKDNIGYVTRGFTYNDTLIINNNEITFLPSSGIP